MADIKAHTFTKVITAAIFILPEGYKEIFLENIGAGDVSWIGDVPFDTNGVTQDAIVLRTDRSFTYPYIGVSRGEFIFDATASILQISAQR